VHNKLQRQSHNRNHSRTMKNWSLRKSQSSLQKRKM